MEAVEDADTPDLDAYTAEDTTDPEQTSYPRKYLLYLRNYVFDYGHNSAADQMRTSW